MIRRLPACLALCGVVVLGALGTVVATGARATAAGRSGTPVGHGVALPAGAGR